MPGPDHLPPDSNGSVLGVFWECSRRDFRPGPEAGRQGTVTDLVRDLLLCFLRNLDHFCEIFGNRHRILVFTDVNPSTHPASPPNYPILGTIGGWAGRRGGWRHESRSARLGIKRVRHEVASSYRSISS